MPKRTLDVAGAKAAELGASAALLGGAVDCGICAGRMLGRILSCKEGHCVCEECHEMLPQPKKCPQCRVAFPPSRNRALEAVVERCTACRAWMWRYPRRDLHCPWIVASRACLARGLPSWGGAGTLAGFALGGRGKGQPDLSQGSCVVGESVHVVAWTTVFSVFLPTMLFCVLYSVA